MQEKVIRGHWSDLCLHIVPQKALIYLKNSTISWYIEQQNLIINVMTQTTICTVIMKPLHTRISSYRPVLFIIGGPGPFKWLNLDQKRWSREEKPWSLLLISGFWQYNIAYDISFCCKLYHLSEWRQEKVIRGHWVELRVLQKALKMVKKQQYFMIYWATESYQKCYDPNFYMAQSLWNISTLEEAYIGQYCVLLGVQSPSRGLIWTKKGGSARRNHDHRC